MTPQRRAGLGTNQEAVRRHNLGTLLRHVHGAGQISRAELTSLMGLNRSTIAGLVGELESLGISEHTTPVGGVRQGAGRPSAGVRIAAEGPFVIAVDLGVDRAVVARVGLGGRVLERAQAPVHSDGEAWQVGAAVAALIRQVVEDAPPAAPLVGIGISVPGLVRRSDGLIRLAPNLEWHDVSFGPIVLAALGLDVPVSLANDADLGALAEHVRGAGVGGNLGCWETEVGGHAIAEAIDCPPDKVAQLDEVLEGFTVAPRGLRTTGTALGHGLASIVNTFNPRLVVLGGYFRSLYPLVGTEVDKGLADRALPAPLESVTLVVPALGSDSALLGAAEIALEPLFVDPVAALGAGLVDVRARLAG
jgi:predicted NBD/HSP70 family sugar kinase